MSTSLLTAGLKVKFKWRSLSTLPNQFEGITSYSQSPQKSYQSGSKILFSRLSTLHGIPPGTWDSHMHVVDPQKYPLSPSAKYIPHAHSLKDYNEAITKILGIKNAVLVQPSIYGTDNTCLLDALRELTPNHGRGVVELDPETITQNELIDWHEIGVRGVRVNLKSVGKVLNQRELREELSKYAKVIKPFNWVLQVYVPLDMVSDLETIVPDLGVKLCIDHFGSPELPPRFRTGNSFDPSSLTGFDSLVRLLQSGTTWIKLSAPYRLTSDPQMRDLEKISRIFLKVASNRVVYATDWPHTRFDNIDPKPFAEACLKWCDGDDGLIERLFAKNGQELWDAKSS